MRYVNLGSTGLRVSRVCLGTMSYGRHESRRWALDEAAAEPIVRRAVDGGVIFFDTADLDMPVIERAAEIAAQRGVSTAQVALSWLLHKPGVTAPIVGATRLEHLEEALAAEQLSLGDEDIARLEEPYVPHPVSGIEL